MEGEKIPEIAHIENFECVRTRRSLFAPFQTSQFCTEICYRKNSIMISSTLFETRSHLNYKSTNHHKFFVTSQNMTARGSEYSGSAVDGSAPVAPEDSEARKAAIKAAKAQASKARGHLYSVMFKDCQTKIAIIPSLVIGAIPILLYLVFGEVINVFSDTQSPVEERYKRLWTRCLYFVGIACGAGFFKFLDTLLWIRIGSVLSVRIRHELFQNMMRSEVSFFDVNPVGGILTLLSEDAQLVQDAFGSTKGTQISNLAQFLTGIILAYVYSWRLALIATATIPVMFIVIGMFIPKVVKLSAVKFKHLSASMTIAEEALASIRTVKTFNREEKEFDRFLKEMDSESKIEVKIGVLMTTMMMIVMLVIWGATVGNLYYGATLVVDGKLEVGNLFSVFGFTMFGCFGLIMLQGSMQGEQKAIAAGARILALSQHVPTVPFEGGEQIDDFKGHVEFRNVSFKYPTRDVYVLNNVSFEVKPGQMAALVGHSGSGKSTVVQLIERFYDVDEGLILLDGKDIKTLDPRWLHRKMALVAQEPTLFQCTIAENIKYGARDATMAEVEAAAEVANAKKFIEKLAHGFDEMVGEKGSSLSGGQKQRIAIARAVIKDPVILITDEATSALDAASEKKVQLALDKVMENRTAMVVAHRLSTILNADIIYVFDTGEIKEVGTHDTLVELGGVYFNLVQRQLSKELNIAPTTLSGYANGYREPDFLTLTLFADYFQVSVDYLIGYSDTLCRTQASCDRAVERLLYYYEKLSPDGRDLLLDEARLLLKYNRLNRKET